MTVRPERRFDLCAAWNWEFDGAFMGRLQAACTQKGLSFLQITPANLDLFLTDLRQSVTKTNVFLDRAADVDARFLPVSAWGEANSRLALNPRVQAHRASDKARMHGLLIQAGLQTPYTIVLPPFHSESNLPSLDLSPLGPQFTIKPSHGGGSQGVLVGANTLDDVHRARQTFPDDAYLLQATIHPVVLAERPAWFRLIYCLGRVFACWWHPQTHIYTRLSPPQMRELKLEPLMNIARVLAAISRMHLFSSEVALTGDGLFVVVDYLNDPVDLRPLSFTPDGVPEDLLDGIIERFIEACQSSQPGFADQFSELFE